MLRPVLGIPMGAATVCGCLLSLASVLIDAVGWCRTRSYLPAMHERLFQLTNALEGMVSGVVGTAGRAVCAVPSWGVLLTCMRVPLWIPGRLHGSSVPECHSCQGLVGHT